MSIVWCELKAGLFRPIGALILLLFMVHLFASQSVISSDQQSATGHACDLAEMSVMGGQAANLETQQCSTSKATSICSVSCPPPYALKPSSFTALARASVAYNPGYRVFAGRLVSGPEPFPPKIALSS